MDKIFKNLVSTSGVIGAFIYHAEIGMQEKSMPAVFRDENLVRIAKSLIKMLSAGNKGFPDIAEVTLYYEESIVFIREPVDRHYLIVFCDTASGKDRLKRPITQVRSDLKQAIKKQKKKKPAPPLAAVPVINLNDTGLQAEVLMNSSPMSKSLQEMQTSLTKVMGPVAKIIFNDVLNNWIEETGQPSFDSMPVLVDMLGYEINDNAKFKDYQGGIVPYIERQIT
jgi:hypothetical protein